MIYSEYSERTTCNVRNTDEQTVETQKVVGNWSKTEMATLKTQNEIATM